jgi:hypothetical protein
MVPTAPPAAGGEVVYELDFKGKDRAVVWPNGDLDPFTWTGHLKFRGSRLRIDHFGYGAVTPDAIIDASLEVKVDHDPVRKFNGLDSAYFSIFPPTGGFQGGYFIFESTSLFMAFMLPSTNFTRGSFSTYIGTGVGDDEGLGNDTISDYRIIRFSVPEPGAIVLAGQAMAVAALGGMIARGRRRVRRARSR